jgi:ABC-type multidrug transport system fused ATPase/permease subunit
MMLTASRTDGGDLNRPAPRAEPRQTQTLFGLFQEYRWRIVIAYVLLNLENLLVLAQPYCLGRAINDLLSSSYTGLELFLMQYLGHLCVGVCRRVYDARVFNGIYTGIVSRTVIKQRVNGADTSRITARSALSRAYAEFYQQHLPIILQSTYFVCGSLMALGLYDTRLIALCLTLIIPLSVLSHFYRRRSTPLTKGLHDELENEVNVIQSGTVDEIRDHYTRVARWRVRLTDAEAKNFAGMEVFVLVLIVAALARACGSAATEAGNIFAIFRYVIMFVSGLDAVPFMIQQVTRLQDIGKRLQEFD